MDTMEGFEAGKWYNLIYVLEVVLKDGLKKEAGLELENHIAVCKPYRWQ